MLQLEKREGESEVEVFQESHPEAAIPEDKSTRSTIPKGVQLPLSSVITNVLFEAYVALVSVMLASNASPAAQINATTEKTANKVEAGQPETTAKIKASQAESTAKIEVVSSKIKSIDDCVLN